MITDMTFIYLILTGSIILIAWTITAVVRESGGGYRQPPRSHVEDRRFGSPSSLV